MGIAIQPEPTTTPRPVLRPGDPGYVAPAAGIPLAPTGLTGGSLAQGAVPNGTPGAGLELQRTAQGGTNPAGVDRIGLATQQFDSFQRARVPQDRLALQNVTSQAAGMGQLGSGQWRSALTTQDTARQLRDDTERDRLISQATEGAIADAQEAARLGLAERGTQVAEGGLRLAQTGQANQVAQFTAQMAEQAASRLQQGGQFTAQLAETVANRLQNKSLADAQQELNTLIQTGQLTVAQGQLALQQHQTTLQAAQEAARLAEATATRTQQGTQFTAAQTAAAQQEAARLALATTQTTNQATQFGQSLAEQTAARTQQNTQFTTQLAQQASQFGASQEQQFQIAQLADATQNRGLDLNSAQGKQQILVQMAQILGGPTGASNPQLMQALMTALGIEGPVDWGTNGPQNTTPTTTTTPTNQTAPPVIDPATGQPRVTRTM